MVQIVRRESECKTLDQLRYWMYHHSKGMTVGKLPPTSNAIHSHILRAHYATYTLLNCLSTLSLDPKMYGFDEVDGMLLPSKFQRLVPDDLILYCNCVKCSTKGCLCRSKSAPCCKFCKCQNVEMGNVACRNPIIVLQVPVNLSE